jgi:hypothetical protein
MVRTPAARPFLVRTMIAPLEAATVAGSASRVHGVRAESGSLARWPRPRLWSEEHGRCCDRGLHVRPGGLTVRR